MQSHNFCEGLQKHSSRKIENKEKMHNCYVSVPLKARARPLVTTQATPLLDGPVFSGDHLWNFVSKNLQNYAQSVNRSHLI